MKFRGDNNVNTYKLWFFGFEGKPPPPPLGHEEIPEDLFLFRGKEKKGSHTRPVRTALSLSLSFFPMKRNSLQ